MILGGCPGCPLGQPFLGFIRSGFCRLARIPELYLHYKKSSVKRDLAFSKSMRPVQETSPLGAFASGMLISAQGSCDLWAQGGQVYQSGMYVGAPNVWVGKL